VRSATDPTIWLTWRPKYCRFWNISLAVIRGEVANARRTLVAIQFGHNDQRIAPPESMGANLTSMVEQIRAIGGEPILVTPLTRRNFKYGTVTDSLRRWANGLCFRLGITSVVYS
jgi:lysophospholipase L1-like esterase